MGWNTTVLVMNDALSEIEADPEFGKRLADAIKAQNMTAVGAHNPKGGIHCNAAEVIESHHADQVTLVAVGQNRARQVTVVGRMPEPPETDEEMVELLREWLPRGYKITKNR